MRRRGRGEGLEGRGPRRAVMGRVGIARVCDARVGGRVGMGRRGPLIEVRVVLIHNLGAAHHPSRALRRRRRRCHRTAGTLASSSSAATDAAVAAAAGLLEAGRCGWVTNHTTEDGRRRVIRRQGSRLIRQWRWVCVY